VRERRRKDVFVTLSVETELFHIETGQPTGFRFDGVVDVVNGQVIDVGQV